MQLGMIGLGRMGANMVRRLIRNGHECVVFDLNRDSVKALENEGAQGAYSLEEMAQKLKAPRACWVMVPAGGPTQKAIDGMATYFAPGDCIIDGGNSNFRDDIERAAALRHKKIAFVDVGTSGGIWGIDRGYCMMIGGDADAVKRLDPIFRTLAPGRGSIERTPGWEKRTSTAEDGYVYCGPNGAGHFVKMVHNGIEYGLMQAYGEGLDIFKNAGKLNLPHDTKYKFDLAEITELWRRGSVVSSWLLDLTAREMIKDSELSSFTGAVEDSGEGRWTVMAAIEEAVPCDVLTAALYVRFRSRQEHTYAEKVLSAMRHQFGGHVEKPAGG